MSKVSITLSANAGVAIHFGGKRIWVDALHNEKVPGFSTVDTQLQGRMLQSEAFFSPDLIVYTHCHPDHYSRGLTEAAEKLWPKAKLLLPEKEFEEQILVTGQTFSYEEGELTLRFFRLPHEGEQYADVVHYAVMLTAEGKNILIAGDCAVASAGLAQAVAGEKIDLALLDFPWLTLTKGRSFVEKTLQPANWLVYHLPFEKDDVGYRAAAHKAAEAEAIPIRLLCEPLETLEFDL